MANMATVQMPTQLCRENRCVMLKWLWKLNAVYRPRLDRTNDNSASPACTSFQVRLCCLQVNGIRYTTAAAETQTDKRQLRDGNNQPRSMNNCSTSMLLLSSQDEIEKA